MHRTQTEYDDNLTFKVFIFQFINFYSSIIYIAFFKGKFVGYPGHYKHIFGSLRNEEVDDLCCIYISNLPIYMHNLLQCGNGGCLIELAQQLAVIMIGEDLSEIINTAETSVLSVGKQIINNAKEMLVPMLKAWWHRKKVIR